MSKNIIASLLDFIFIGRVTFCKQWAQRSTSGMFKRSFCAPLFLTFGCQVNYYGCEKGTIRIVLLHFLLECLDVLFVNPKHTDSRLTIMDVKSPQFELFYVIFFLRERSNATVHCTHFVLFFKALRLKSITKYAKKLSSCG